MKILDESAKDQYFAFSTSGSAFTKSGWEIPGHVPASPYRVRIVRTPTQLELAVAVRVRAYSEKLQALAAKVQQPGALDFAHEPIILLAENRISGEPIGTLRLNTGPSILNMLEDIDLPDSIVREHVGFVSRMAVSGTVQERHLVRNLMQKAVFQLCMAKQLSRLLLLAVEPRQRLFYRCGFTDVYADGKLRFPAFLDRFPVRVLYADIFSLERQWKEEKHPLYEFFFRTFHPEIEVFSSLSSVAQRSDEPGQPSMARTQRPAESPWIS